MKRWILWDDRLGVNHRSGKSDGRGGKLISGWWGDSCQPEAELYRIILGMH